MMFIYFGENGKYTKCKRDSQVCAVCVCVCVLYNFSFLSPSDVVVVISLVFCFALFSQPVDIDSSSLSWVPHRIIIFLDRQASGWAPHSGFLWFHFLPNFDLYEKEIDYPYVCSRVSRCCEWFCMLSQISYFFFLLPLFIHLPFCSFPLCVALWKYLNSKLQPIKQFSNPEKPRFGPFLRLDCGATFAQVA